MADSPPGLSTFPIWKPTAPVCPPMRRCSRLRCRPDGYGRNAASRCSGKASRLMLAPTVFKPDLDLPARPRILVITLRRLGDVLLTTPLIRSVRRGFEPVRLDALVFRGSDAILRGNP